MTMLGMLVLDQLFIFMRHDALLDVELRTVRGYLRPKIATLANVQTKLQKINLRAPLGQLHVVKLFHFRRAKQIAYTLAQLLSPFLRFHGYPPLRSLLGIPR